jgi:hypothetical protein
MHTGLASSAPRADALRQGPGFPEARGRVRSAAGIVVSLWSLHAREDRPLRLAKLGVNADVRSGVQG